MAGWAVLETRPRTFHAMKVVPATRRIDRTEARVVRIVSVFGLRRRWGSLGQVRLTSGEVSNLSRPVVCFYMAICAYQCRQREIHILFEVPVRCCYISAALTGKCQKVATLGEQAAKKMSSHRVMYGTAPMAPARSESHHLQGTIFTHVCYLPRNGGMGPELHAC